MLIDYVLESENVGLLESALMPFDIYNDAAQQALTVLKQRFLYDEIEAEVLKRVIIWACWLFFSSFSSTCYSFRVISCL